MSKWLSLFAVLHVAPLDQHWSVDVPVNDLRLIIGTPVVLYSLIPPMRKVEFEFPRAVSHGYGETA